MAARDSKAAAQASVRASAQAGAQTSARAQSSSESGDDAADNADNRAPVERLSDDAFRDQLGEVIPHLRAFGRSLSGNRDTADDLVQETLLKA